MRSQRDVWANGCFELVVFIAAVTLTLGAVGNQHILAIVTAWILVWYWWRRSRAQHR